MSPDTIVLRAAHEYLTLLEFVSRSVRSGSPWAAAWKLHVFELRDTKRPLPSLGPTIVEASLPADAQIQVLRLKRELRRRPGRDFWAAQVDELGDGESEEGEDEAASDDGSSDGADPATDASA